MKVKVKFFCFFDIWKILGMDIIFVMKCFYCMFFFIFYMFLMSVFYMFVFNYLFFGFDEGFVYVGLQVFFCYWFIINMCLLIQIIGKNLNFLVIL